MIQFVWATSPVQAISLNCPLSIKMYTCNAIRTKTPRSHSTLSGWKTWSTTMTQLPTQNLTLILLKTASSTSEILMHSGITVPCMMRWSNNVLKWRDNSAWMRKALTWWKINTFKTFDKDSGFHQPATLTFFGSGSSISTKKLYCKTTRTKNWVLPTFSPTVFTKVFHTCKTTFNQAFWQTWFTLTWLTNL